MNWGSGITWIYAAVVVGASRSERKAGIGDLSFEFGGFEFGGHSVLCPNLEEGEDGWVRVKGPRF